jgi:hypothetical protein
MGRPNSQRAYLGFRSPQRGILMKTLDNQAAN